MGLWAVQPPPPPNSWGAPGTGGPQWTPDFIAAAPVGANNGKALASMILGIAGIFTCGLGSVLAVIFGHVSRGEIRRSGGRQQGGGMALAGLILGYAVLGIVLVVIVLAVIGATLSSSNT